MKVECEVDYTEVENESGREVPGVIVTCGRCGHEVESFGHGDGSVRRCFALLKEECPNNEKNFYVEEGEVASAYTKEDRRPKSRVVASSQPQVTPPVAPPSAPAGTPRFITEDRLAIFKVATTGRSAKSDEIVQIGIIQIDYGVPMWRLQMNIKPGIPVSEGAAAVHGLTEARLASSPTIAQAAQAIHQAILGRVLIGYNIDKFDMPIFTRQISAASGTAYITPPTIDVLLLERRFAQDELGQKKHDLKTAAQRWGLPIAPNFDTINDAKVIWGVLAAMCARIPELGSMSMKDLVELLKAESALTALGSRTSREATARL